MPARGVTLAKIEVGERAAIPLGRFAEPEEPASAVAFLAPAAGRYLYAIEPATGSPSSTRDPMRPISKPPSRRRARHFGLAARMVEERLRLLLRKEIVDP